MDSCCPLSPLASIKQFIKRFGKRVLRVGLRQAKNLTNASQVNTGKNMNLTHSKAVIGTLILLLSLSFRPGYAQPDDRSNGKSNNVAKQLWQVSIKIDDVVTKLMITKNDAEFFEIANTELASRLIEFRKLPPTLTPLKICNAVRNSSHLKQFSLQEKVRLASALIAVGSVNGGPQANGDDRDFDCGPWYELYAELTLRFESQFDDWDDCLKGDTSSSTGTGTSHQQSQAPWPGIPDVALGESTYGECGPQWDDMQNTLLELESIEFGMQAEGCF